MRQSQQPISLQPLEGDDLQYLIHDLVRWCPDSYQVVKFNCSDAMIDSRNHPLGDGRSVDMFRVKSVTQSRYPGRDFVKLDTFLTAVCRR